MAKTSVLTATYNGSKTIKETLGSLLSQTADIEVMIVDDGSTDDTVKIIKEINDPGIKLIEQKNSGSPAAPRNKGIKESSGDFIALCDQDDLWYTKKIKKQVEAYEKFDQKENIGIIICTADIIDAEGKIIGQNIEPDGFISAKDAFNDLLIGDFITACSAVIPKKVLDEVGYFDEKLRGVDDYDLWLRITQKYGILSIAESLCAWRSSRNTLSAIKSSSYLETENVFEKLGDKSPEIKWGHGKNLMRLFVSFVLEGKKREAINIIPKILGYPISQKAKIILGLFKFSYYVGLVLIKSMDKSGLISL